MKKQMKSSKLFWIIAGTGILALILIVLSIPKKDITPSNNGVTAQTDELNKNVISGTFDKTKFKSNEEWQKLLTPEQFYILREAGTEAPFTGSLLHNEKKGTYYSAGCDEPVFRSEQKYDSGTGWPSFWAPIKEDAVVLKNDYTLGTRTEVLDTCGGHLGHVFDDGPQPTGKRYCMNSDALYFVPDKE